MKQATRIQKILHTKFGLESLRGAQADVIDAVLKKENTLAIMPTGAGKSLCFQLPALLIPGTTLVISPLIALMKDQQQKLESLEIASLQLNSSLKASEQKHAIESLAETDFIYTTPERLLDPEFIAKLKAMTIDFVVIDEAHCITQWGHDFRPAYLSIRDAIAQIGHPPILALTATATEAVAEDIRMQLGLKTMTVIRSGVFRDNLRYEAVVCDSEEDKIDKLMGALATDQRQLQGPGIIYASSIKAVDEIYARLAKRAGGVEKYHGRLSATERHQSQDRFMNGESELMIATNAFGMGIDKADLRFVVHFNFPGSLEAYYQETGRAGRDGEVSRCLLLYLKNDQRTQNFFLAGKHPKADQLLQVYRVLEISKATVSLTQLQAACPAVPKSKVRVIANTLRDAGLITVTTKGAKIKRGGATDGELTRVADKFVEKAHADHEKLKSMIIYAQTAMCRWNGILQYFGEPGNESGCQICDNCERLKAHPIH